MDDTLTLKQTQQQIDRQLIAAGMTRLMQDPTSDVMTLAEIKRLAIAILRLEAKA